MMLKKITESRNSQKINLSIFILSLAIWSACGVGSGPSPRNQSLRISSSNAALQQPLNRMEGVILWDYYDLNYLSGYGPWSDHAPVRYGSAVVWNIAQKVIEPTPDQRLEGRVPNHKFREINRSETDQEYRMRLQRVVSAIHEIMTSDPAIDLFLLQELPFGEAGREFAQELQQNLDQHQLVLVTNARPRSQVTGSQGIVTRRGRSVRYEWIAPRVLQQLGWSERTSDRRKTVFRLSPFCLSDLRSCYVSTHSVFGDNELTADTCRVMAEMSRQLVMRHRGFTIYFGGDFNRSLSTLMQQQVCRDLEFQGHTTAQEQRASGSSGDDPDVNRNVDLWIQMRH